MSVELPTDARARLDAHLDAVEQALTAAGRSREQRRAVVDDLETQILDMLANRSVVPTLAEIEGVLSGLDPPAAYGETAAGKAAAGGPAPVSKIDTARTPRYSRAAIWGCVCILTSLLPMLVILAIGIYLAANYHPSPHVVTGPETMSGPKWRVFIVMILPLSVIVTLGLAGTILGWVGLGQIRAAPGMVRGKGLALFDGLFYPILVVSLVVVVVVGNML